MAPIEGATVFALTAGLAAPSDAVAPFGIQTFAERLDRSDALAPGTTTMRDGSPALMGAAAPAALPAALRPTAKKILPATADERDAGGRTRQRVGPSLACDDRHDGCAPGPLVGARRARRGA